ncbi:MAG TPA: DNA phosphorothioation system sulfurtransferase DndC [Chthoniobacteraceae bacterium]|nr:DNA phosphorothioation system sulfurtransferase DndC [Chthoniobacteraceae bacterium]
MTDLDALIEKLRGIRRAIRAQYCEPDLRPWIIGFSGGKDSTLLTHLVVEAMLSVAPDQRTRPVFIVCNDTLVESPIFHTFVGKMLTQIEENIASLKVPVQVIRTHPLPEESFWVNLLGRGYPAPNRTFRWCTDRMKIRPTSRFIREQVSHAGEAILLLGVRSSESATRAGSVARHAEKEVGRLSPHPDHKGVSVFSPIKELLTDEVWTALLSVRPPWGGTYRDVVTLYKNALGGECPFVVSNDDAPSCGTNSARFGCWTCTVVEKDSSIESLIAAGHQDLLPLADYRNRLKAVSENPEYRSKTRRNGQPGLGPLTYEARRMLLDELLAIQIETGMELISPLEVRLVREQWAVDRSENAYRELEKIADAQEKVLSSTAR